MKDLSGLFFLSLFFFSIQAAHSQTVSYYISDAGNFNLPPWQILKFDENGQNGQVFISNHLDWPQDIVFLEASNTVLISNLNSGNISRFNATTGDYINEFATGIEGPTRMKIGKDSLLYVLQWNGVGKVLRFTLDGTAMGAFTTVGVKTSIGIDWDSAGNLYVSSYNGKSVRKFSSTGEDKGNFISTGLAGPTNIWFNASGDLMVNDYNAGIVKRYDASGVFKANFISNVPQCEGVSVQPDGKIIIGVGGTSSVRIYNADGTFAKDLVPSGTLNLLTPNGVIKRSSSMSTGINTIHHQGVQMATPSIGTLFHFSDQDDVSDGIVQICNDAGTVLGKINLAESVVWDASSYPDGIYFLSLQLNPTTVARQKLIVQH